MVANGGTSGSQGPAIDRHGDDIVDPTKNVLDLVAASIQRQDDLRSMESVHLRELMALRAAYEEKIRKGESGRIDAIRAVDVGAVQRAAEVQLAQATALAAQTTVLSETLRTQVAAAAAAAQTSLAAALEPIQTAILDLRRAQYETQGQKAQVVETRATGSYAMALIGAFGGLILLGIAIVGFIVANKP